MEIHESLIEKDYWIMHVLYGLQKQGFDFELKGGTSLSKGYKIIDRFSEDIDIHIKPPASLSINENTRNTNKKTIEARKNFYDWVAGNINIDGIVSIERDTVFDDLTYYRSGGIRLLYENKTDKIGGVKGGVLLEAGFDTVTPNTKLKISSWAYERALENKSIQFIDNRAIDIPCYHPGYTFVEKLQTIATKYRQEINGEKDRPNFMRQYYDVYCLLGVDEVIRFIGTPEYEAHKQKRFPGADLKIPVSQNEAFLLNTPAIRSDFKKRYTSTAALYYKGQPDFDELIMRIKEFLPRL